MQRVLWTLVGAPLLLTSILWLSTAPLVAEPLNLLVFTRTVGTYKATSVHTWADGWLKSTLGSGG